jgi:predicted nucleotidyltransferase
MSRERLESELRSFFAGRGDVAAAYLFGSSARGTAGTSSDVDIGVLFIADPPKTLEGIQDLLEDRLTQLTQERVDLVILNDAPCDLVHRVLRDGILLCENDKSRRVAFEVKKRNEYFDMAPIRALYRAARPQGRP